MKTVMFLFKEYKKKIRNENLVREMKFYLSAAIGGQHKMEENVFKEHEIVYSVVLDFISTSVIIIWP